MIKWIFYFFKNVWFFFEVVCEMFFVVGCRLLEILFLLEDFIRYELLFRDFVVDDWFWLK